MDFATNYNRNGRLLRNNKSKKVLLKKRAGTVIGNSVSAPASNYNSIGYMDDNHVQQRKFSNIIPKKFTEFMGRKTASQSPSIVSVPSNQSPNQPSIHSESGMNLDNINATFDAESISSGNRSQCEDDDDNKIRGNNNINNNPNNNSKNVNNDNDDNSNKGNRVSIDTSVAPSEVMTDLP